MKNKIFSLNNLSKILLQDRNRKKIVLCHGVFDLVHIGHVEHFRKAKSLGDILVVTITADEFVNKGPGRPYFDTNLRQKFLSSLEMIDYVSVVNSLSAVEAIRSIRPNFYCKGRDYKDNSKDITNKIKKEIYELKKVNGKIIYTEEVTFSSSKLINSEKIGLKDNQFKILNSIKARYSYQKIESIFLDLSKTKVLVIGEAIIDKYNFCDPLGKSGKDPIMMFKNIRSESYAGGSAAISNHLGSFTNAIKLISTCGFNKDKIFFFKKNFKNRIKSVFISKKNSPTIVKEKYIDDISKTKLIGFYNFNDSSLSPSEEKKLKKEILNNIKKHNFVIVADYGHGMISNKMSNLLSKKVGFLSVNAQINAANYGHHTLKKYSRSKIIFINESELRHELRERELSTEELMKIFSGNIKVSYVIVTRGSEGAILYDKINNKFIYSPSFADKVLDKIGAGDAMFAIFSIFLYKTKDLEFSLFISSLAAAQSVQNMGNSKSVDKNIILKTIRHLIS
jgi:rfaE bifunctional protein kinase chain/domain